MRQNSTENVTEIAIREFPCSSPMRTTFQAMIAMHRQAVFDCFKPPAWLCDCYKCQSWQKNQNEFVDMFETTMDLMHEAENRKVSSDSKLGNVFCAVPPVVPETMDGIYL